MNSILILERFLSQIILVYQTQGHLQPERVVGNRSLFYEGVPIDYSYNQTMVSSPGTFVSVPGCPRANDGYPWVIFGEPPKCYLVGQKSVPCPSFTVMQYRAGSEYGECACDFTKCRRESFWTHRNSSSPRYDFCYPGGYDCLEYVYDKVESHCRILYSQGPCKEESEWLQLDQVDGVKCVQRLCPSGMSLFQGAENGVEQEQRGGGGGVGGDEIQCCPPNVIISEFQSIPENKCGGDKIWSEALKQCIPHFNISGLVIG